MENLETKTSRQSPEEQQYGIGGEVEENANWTIYNLLVVAAEVLGIVSIVLVGVWGEKYMKGYAWDGSARTFNYHPLFMVLGFVFFYGNAVITYRTLRTTTKFQAKLIHAGFQAIGFVFAVVGLVAVFRFHNHGNIPNMYSLHSWIGIGATVLFSCQFLFGFLAFLLPLFSASVKKNFLKVHVFFGMVILAMIVAACVSGLTEKMLFSPQYKWSAFVAAGNMANVIAVCLILFGTIVAYLIYNPLYKRKQESYEELQ